MSVEHKGWDWTDVTSDSWNLISEEFLPVAINWCQKFKSILDLGTGKGRHAFFFAKNGLSSSAIDLSESGIEYVKQTAKELGLEVNAKVADMISIPFEDESFDGIICFHTIYHTDFNGMKKVLSEIYRLLKDRGEAYLTFNSKENPNFDKDKSIDGYTMISSEGFEKGIPHAYIDEKDIWELTYPFKIISMNKIQHFIRNGNPAKGIHYFVHIKKEK